MSLPLPIVQSIPHGGLTVPPLVVDQLAIDAVSIFNECDLWVDEIFAFDFGDLAKHEPVDRRSSVLASTTMEIARVFVDANRPPDSLNDPDGAVKSATSYGERIYHSPMSHDVRRQLLDRHWRPFHAELEATLRREVDSVRIFLDCHNMAQEGPSAYSDPGQPRPLLCISNMGNTRGEAVPSGPPVSAPGAYIRKAAEIAAELFADLELLQPNTDKPAPVVQINQPFNGGYILRHYTSPQYQRSLGRSPDNQYLGMMVEVNRGLFVGNQTERFAMQPPNHARIAAVRCRLFQWVKELVGLL